MKYITKIPCFIFDRDRTNETWCIKKVGENSKGEEQKKKKK